MPLFTFSNASSKDAMHSLEDEPVSSWGDPLESQPDEAKFLSRLLDLYWTAVYREVKEILISLLLYADIEETEIEKEYRKTPIITGFEAFVNQVCEEPKSNQSSEDWTSRHSQPQPPIHPLRKAAPENGETLAKAVAEQLEGEAVDKELSKFRAQCLLRSAGFLDIDKLIEYREPIEKFSIWKRGKVNGFAKEGTPVLEPERCATRKCRQILRGTFFRCTYVEHLQDPKLETGPYICEDCFRAGTHPPDHLVKVHKHSILDETITPQISQRICRCSEVSRFDEMGNLAKLYPVDTKLKHRLRASGKPQCRLFSLPGLVAEAKHRQLAASLETRKKKLADIVRKMPTKDMVPFEPHYAIGAGLVEELDANMAFVPNAGISRFPFGNTHVALMIGPLVIENGYTKKGVLISQRSPLNYFDSPDIDDQISYCLALSEERQVFAKHQTKRRERRLKACMKQIVSGAFSNFCNQELESEIVSDLVNCMQIQVQSISLETSQFLNGVRAVTAKLKILLGTRIEQYLKKITARLFNPNVTLKWGYFLNNCQAFTDAILTYEDFGELFRSPDGHSSKLTYLLSFVVRAEGYNRSKIVTKHDVPNGLTEEYILSFRSGRHDDSDIIGTLEEYWFDWGGFGGPLYKHQDNFPWDCTEAYKKDSSRCNDCTLAHHVWAFPFDSWSIILLSLQKDRCWYPSKQEGNKMDTNAWAKNRMSLFIAQEALCRGAVAMSKTSLPEASSWLKVSRQPQFDRLKLGGIHRAQPYSHHFEQGHFRQVYVADWIHLLPAERIRQYEALRSTRQSSDDVKHYRSKRPIPQSSNMAGIWSAISLQTSSDSFYLDTSYIHAQHTVASGLAVTPGPDLTSISSGGIFSGGIHGFDFSGVIFGGHGDGGAGSNSGGGGGF